MYEFFVRTLFFYVHVTRKKLPKRRSYEKNAQKTLMKLTEGGREGGSEGGREGGRKRQFCKKMMNNLEEKTKSS